jgi:large subunit ribosomal protein L24
MFIRKNDNVVILSGDDATRGTSKIHRVISVNPKAGTVLVEGAGTVKKAIKPNRRNPKGGILSKEMPLPVCKVMLYCSACGKGARCGARATADGGKERYCKRCGAALGRISKAPARVR